MQKELEQLNSEKEQLLQIKNASEKNFTEEQQARLSDVTEAIFDLEEQIELAPSEKIAKGTEKMVQVRLISGNRFDPKTGKEIRTPSFQMFNFGEWELFKKNYKRLGYTITEVVNDPFKDAAQLINK